MGKYLAKAICAACGQTLLLTWSQNLSSSSPGLLHGNGEQVPSATTLSHVPIPLLKGLLLWELFDYENDFRAGGWGRGARRGEPVMQLEARDIGKESANTRSRLTFYMPRTF